MLIVELYEKSRSRLFMGLQSTCWQRSTMSCVCAGCGFCPRWNRLLSRSRNNGQQARFTTVLTARDEKARPPLCTISPSQLVFRTVPGAKGRSDTHNLCPMFIPTDAKSH